MERLRGLHRQRRRGSAGIAVSALIHGVIFVAAFLVARGVANVVVDQNKPILTFHAPPPPPPPKGGHRTTPKKDIVKKPDPTKIIIPKVIPPVPEPPDTPPVEEDNDEPEIPGGVEGGVEGGVVGGVVGGVIGGELGSTIPVPEDNPDEVREVTIGTTPPSLLHKEPPEYPAIAIRAGVEGEVVLRCIIDTKGNVQVDKVLKAPKLLEDAAIRAVKNWKYQPAIYKDHPQAVYLIVRINFTKPKK